MHAITTRYALGASLFALACTDAQIGTRANTPDAARDAATIDGATMDAIDGGTDGLVDGGTDGAMVGCPCDPRDEAARILGEEPIDCGVDLDTAGGARACVESAQAMQRAFILEQEVHDYDSSTINVLFGTSDGRVFSAALYLFQRPDLGLCNPVQLQQCGSVVIMDREDSWPTTPIFTCENPTDLTPMCQQSWGAP